MRVRHENVIKDGLELEFWIAYDKDDLDGMNSAITKMSRINDGDSHRLWIEKKKKENENA